MVFLTYLDKPDSSREVIHYCLIPRRVPPFDREVKFTSCRYQPIIATPYQFVEGANPIPLIFGEVDIPFEMPGKDADPQAFTDVFHKAMDEMVRQLITAMY